MLPGNPHLQTTKTTLSMYRLANHDCRSRRTRHWFVLPFKLTFIFTTMVLLQASGRALSQNVTLSANNSPLREVFGKIETQTGYQFFYKAEVLKEAVPVTIQLRNSPVLEAIRSCFQGQPLDYYIEDK